MVESSMAAAERRAWNRVIALGFVLLVAGSCALVGYANGASLAVTAALGLFGLLLGAGLAWYLASLSLDTSGRRLR